MNPRNSLILLIPLLFPSCGEDPKLIEKKNTQDAEISRLKGEVALVEEKLKNLPPDVSEELQEKRKEISDQQAEIKKLEMEIQEQQERKNTLQREFDAYKAKYKIN
jgi:peptidoglycan hydrolase CwlO-like protein